MGKTTSWFKDSNHYKHILGGMLVGLWGFSLWTAVYGGVIAASCLEYKDYAYGNKWDWIDWGCTFIGALMGCGLMQLLNLAK